MMAARAVLILTREAGEGDQPKAGGGGDPTHRVCGRPLHRLWRSPSPVTRGRITEAPVCRLEMLS